MSPRLTIVVLACLISASALALADNAKRVDVPAGNLIEGLESLARQCGVDVIYPSNELKGLKTRGVSGTLEPKDAFRKLIEGTPLILKEQGSAVLISLPSASTPALVSPPSDTANSDGPSQEGKKSSSGGFRVAQVDQGQTSSPSTVEKQDEQASKKKSVQLEEVVVTGSRIPVKANEGAQEVKVYTREQIDQSGQTNVGDFLNTLPDVSVANTGNIFQSGNGTGSTVQLHGLPVGATLVLLNGRRVETSGSQQFANFFDLNNIPLAAVERVEVVSEGSSAIYGSNAIAGVVNIIFKNDLNGLAVNAKYGGAVGTHELDGSLAWGKKWDRASLSVVTSSEYQSELRGTQRALTASSNFTAYGGPNNNFPVCTPGNIFSVDGVTALPGLGTATYAAVPNGFKGTPSIQEFQGTAGTLNECGLSAPVDFIPTTHRQAIFATGHFDVTPSVTLFTELLYSHVQVDVDLGPQEDIFGQPGFQSFTVPASNPFNPFGTAVGIAELTPPEYVNAQTTDFVRPVIGARGSFLGKWHWEVSTWDSQDRSTNSSLHLNDGAAQTALNSSNPATALNPFVDGPPGSPQLLQSVSYVQRAITKGQLLAATGVVRGPFMELPAGPLQLALGADYNHDTLYEDTTATPTFPAAQSTYHRTRYAAFGEARVPILARRESVAAGDTLALTVAGRYDHFNDFGSKTTPQIGAEWRPAASLLIRATYSHAFDAPSLFDLHQPSVTQQTVVLDPARGNQAESVPDTQGGNPRLKPETGQTRTFGLVYSSRLIPGLQVSLTRWGVEESNNIQFPSLATIINNSNLFPGYVVRAPSCSDGPPCPIVQLYDVYVNFGDIKVAGFDFSSSYKFSGLFGVLIPSLAVTETDRYSVSLTPGSPAVDASSIAQDSGNWAPRWKGTAALGWALGAYTANVNGRYVGRYQDYDTPREIGNFWIFDANFRWAIGRSIVGGEHWLKDTYLTLGGVNIFNRLPQFSNYFSDFVGYDPTQADLRGRFLYVQVGWKW
jgi:iron complex outermembrane receptor protein